MHGPPYPLTFGFELHCGLWDGGTAICTEEWSSPDGRYAMRYEVRACAGGEEIGCCLIYDNQSKLLVARLVRDNYTPPQFTWLQRPSGLILIWASTYEYGYEIVHFGTHSLVHVEDSDGRDFIWTDCKLSPDENRLAVGGCYWACPYEIRILDVSADPPFFPLKELVSLPMSEGKLSWIDHETLAEVKGEMAFSRHAIGPFVPSKTLCSWQAWDDPNGGITFVPSESIGELRKSGLLSAQAVLRHRVSAMTGEQAMMQHFLLMGWEPYKPQGASCACPNGCGAEYYPEGYGDCPNCGHIG